MNRSRTYSNALAVAGIALACLVSVELASAQELDRRKLAIEGPVKTVLATPDALRALARPQEVENGTDPTQNVDANPTVEPGKVRWHDDLAAACRASAASGKPVLLFQLLGRLDQRFT